VLYCTEDCTKCRGCLKIKTKISAYKRRLQTIKTVSRAPSPYSTAVSTARYPQNTAVPTATPFQNTAVQTATPSQNTAVLTATPSQNTAVLTATPSQNTAVLTATPPYSTYVFMNQPSLYPCSYSSSISNAVISLFSQENLCYHTEIRPDMDSLIFFTFNFCSVK